MFDEIEIFHQEPQHDERGAFEYSYGNFGSGDPRDFTPDYEMCTEDEIASWKADLALVEAGNTVVCPPAGQWFYDKDGKPMMHILAPRYGVGTIKYRFDETDDTEAVRP